jgi:hypothetical protein
MERFSHEPSNRIHLPLARSSVPAWALPCDTPRNSAARWRHTNRRQRYNGGCAAARQRDNCGLQAHEQGTKALYYRYVAASTGTLTAYFSRIGPKGGFTRVLFSMKKFEIMAPDE